MNYEIGNPEMAWLLLAVPSVAMLFLYARWSNRRARQRFGATSEPSRWLSGSISGTLLTLGFVLLVLACMDIRWGKITREVPQKGLEVVFALDVSRSMLAEDAKPNRLTRAKQQIKDMLATMAGDRVGLVVFAGEANQAVPLTNHYHDFQEKLDSVGPESVSVGGSQLGIAIKAASEAFLSKTNDHKTMVLFTDGEDQESQPIELAKQLHAESGLRIFTVGLGDMTEGARIPNPSDARGRGSRASKFVQHEGQQVWSKLNGSILKTIATESNAAYIPAGTKRVNMADVYHRYIANVEQSEFETAKINAFIPRYQWFAFPAFVCLFLHTLIGTESRKRDANRTSVDVKLSSNPSIGSAIGKAAAIVLLLPNVAFCQTSDGESVAARINAANDLLRQQNVAEAIDAYNAIDAAASDNQAKLQYNLASAHYRNSDIEAAEDLFAITAKSNDERIARDSLYNLGNCHYAKALIQVEQDPGAAIAELESAIKQYRGALRSDRTFSDARENLERAKKLIEQLKDAKKEQEQKKEQQEQGNEQNKQQQSQQTDDQSQDDSNSKQSSDDQNNESENSEQQSFEEQAQQENSDQSESSQNQQQGNSSDSKEQSGQQSEGNEQNTKQQQSEQQSGESQKPSGSQDASERTPDTQTSQPSNQANQQPDQNAAASDERNDGMDPPDGKLSVANQSELEKQADDGKAQTVLARHGDEANDNEMMTRQEALKLLQAVRDRDMLRRLRQKQRQRQNRVQVEKDW